MRDVKLEVDSTSPKKTRRKKGSEFEKLGHKNSQ